MSQTDKRREKHKIYEEAKKKKNKQILTVVSANS